MPSQTSLPMQPDIMILSILDRYENNLPVTIEEKAVLHEWLMKTLRARNFLKPIPTSAPMKIRDIRRKIKFWQYVLIILTITAIIITLYMFAVKTGTVSTRKPDDNVHFYYQEVWPPGRENRVDFS